MIEVTLPPSMADHCESHQLSSGKILLVVRDGKQVMLFFNVGIFEDWVNENDSNHTDYKDIIAEYDNEEISDEERDNKLANWLRNVFSLMEANGGPSKLTLDMRELVNSVQFLIGRNITLFPDPVSLANA